MVELIEALCIFMRYGGNGDFNCSHDELAYCGLSDKDIKRINPEDLKRLEDIGFHYNECEGYFYSFKYGSC